MANCTSKKMILGVKFKFIMKEVRYVGTTIVDGEVPS